MNIRVFFRLFICAIIVFTVTSMATVDSHKMKLKFTNIRSSSGQIEVQIYKDKETFKKETPYKVYFVSKENMKDKTVYYTLENLPAGTYGIAVMDDENKNRKMDYKFMLPQEGFGFSNYYHSSMTMPKFESFQFDFNKDMEVTFKLRYL